MLATHHDILKYIPQRPPFVLVNELIEATGKSAVTRFKAAVGHVLVKNGFLSEPGLIENIAQTAAVQSGYACVQLQKEVPVGFIASVKDFVLFRRVPAGAEIITEVHITDYVLNMTLARGTIHCNDDKVCACEIRIFIDEKRP